MMRPARSSHLSSAATPRFWRRPLDADRLTRITGTVHVLEERCKGCAYCVEFCPREVLTTSERFNLKGYHPPDVREGSECVACRLCEIICPEFAISIEEHQTEGIGHVR